MAWPELSSPFSLSHVVAYSLSILSRPPSPPTLYSAGNQTFLTFCKGWKTKNLCLLIRPRSIPHLNVNTGRERAVCVWGGVRVGWGACVWWWRSRGAVYIGMQTGVWKCKWGLGMGSTGRGKENFRRAGGGGLGLKMIRCRERENEQCYDQSAICRLRVITARFQRLM